MRYVILENVRSRHNVGAIFRTCDAALVTKIFLVGYTPTPIDRFGRLVPEIQKTSLGASDMVDWSHTDTIEEVIHELHIHGVSVVAVEQSKGACSLYDFNEPEQVAYIMGNEVAGVSQEALALCDAIVEIPMRGMKESLNVSVATGIVLFQQ